MIFAIMPLSFLDLALFIIRHNLKVRNILVS